MTNTLTTGTITTTGTLTRDPADMCGLPDGATADRVRRNGQVIGAGFVGRFARC